MGTGHLRTNSAGLKRNSQGGCGWWASLVPPCPPCVVPIHRILASIAPSWWSSGLSPLLHSLIHLWQMSLFSLTPSRGCLRPHHSWSAFKCSPLWESFSLGLNGERRDSKWRTNLGSSQNHGLLVLLTAAVFQTELAFFPPWMRKEEVWKLIKCSSQLATQMQPISKLLRHLSLV